MLVNNYGTIVNNYGTIVNNAQSKSRQKWGRKCGTGKSGELYPPNSETRFETIFDCYQPEVGLSTIDKNCQLSDTDCRQSILDNSSHNRSAHNDTNRSHLPLQKNVTMGFPTITIFLISYSISE